MDTYNKLTALTAKCSTERSHISKGGRGKLFLSVEVQNLYIHVYKTVVVDVGPFGSVGCVARVPSRLWPVFDSSVLN